MAALEAEFGISPMTARRDLVELEKQGVARRTHGGAILPGLSSHEDSFFKRLEVAVEEKERLAEAAVAQLSHGDASSSIARLPPTSPPAAWSGTIFPARCSRMPFP